ncbi:hypothetical protein MPTK1_6g10300 [Marchantia polymorpha subsp. ruderalis]|uniref:Uncharacterized protein n=2 Tax=Marchantia polymorpha TaxID=3197 RepID=A0AAF6BQJ2_MARPO|nr:hypothetical protein MARPO_0016s0073 [Marchantia polymorpha]PTQ45012.1 hypothetical protein MARPO_0016s0073 [Marchantia polymorpha]BBN14276.1 hypothetical protein Mp_6g10300 [Marchantia polymorpha subsp. ruderalis]|eukprot:PTQ45011.1 hypothetical protein MARPO_0016s0073 [Marchantia polymorpha]
MDAGVLLPSFLTILVSLSAVNAEETPIPSDDCARCPNRVEVGNHWMCCSDCSEAKVTNHIAETGFCRSGAQLSIQPKSREVLRWITREWGVCSNSCGGGIRERSVRCVGSLEYSPQQLYYVNETKCDPLKMPPKQEYCNTRPCHGGDHSHAISLHHKERRHKEHHKEHKEYKEHRVYKERHSPHKRKGLPLWAIMMISLVTVSAAAGLAFGAYVMYRRRTSNENHGFVYVMLDSYAHHPVIGEPTGAYQSRKDCKTTAVPRLRTEQELERVAITGIFELFVMLLSIDRWTVYRLYFTACFT